MKFSERVAAYDKRWGDSISDDAQKAERIERLELKSRRRAGYKRYFGVPALPWKQEA